MSTTPPTVGAPVPVNGATIALPERFHALRGRARYTHRPSLCLNPAQPPLPQHCGTLDIVNLTRCRIRITTIRPRNCHHRRLPRPHRYERQRPALHRIARLHQHRQCQQLPREKCAAASPSSTRTEHHSRSSRRITATSPACRASPLGDVEYVAEGGNLRVYDTLTDSLILPNTYIETGTHHRSPAKSST